MGWVHLAEFAPQCVNDVGFAPLAPFPPQIYDCGHGSSPIDPKLRNFEDLHKKNRCMCLFKDGIKQTSHGLGVLGEGHATVHGFAPLTLFHPKFTPRGPRLAKLWFSAFCTG